MMAPDLAPVSSPVLRVGHFSRALLVYSCQAPKPYCNVTDTILRRWVGIKRFRERWEASRPRIRRLLAASRGQAAATGPPDNEISFAISLPGSKRGAADRASARFSD